MKNLAILSLMFAGIVQSSTSEFLKQYETENFRSQHLETGSPSIATNHFGIKFPFLY